VNASAVILTIAAAAAPAAVSSDEPMAKAGLRAAPGAKPVDLDFDGDGKLETAVVAVVIEPDAGAKVDDPWARKMGEKNSSALKRGERLLAIAGPGGTVWALRNAVFDRGVPLRHGTPSQYDACWKSGSRDALLVGTQDAAGVIAWNGIRFDWIQCGD
jgi:hypothetical protein